MVTPTAPPQKGRPWFRPFFWTRRSIGLPHFGHLGVTQVGNLRSLLGTSLLGTFASYLRLIPFRRLVQFFRRGVSQRRGRFVEAVSGDAMVSVPYKVFAGDTVSLSVSDAGH